MGNCCVSGSSEITDAVSYVNNLTVKIREKDGKGNVLSADSVYVMLTSPSIQSFDKIQIEKVSYCFSSCVIPGLDPRGLIAKECQDAVFYVSVQNTILVGLFDGHGKEGEKVVAMCSTIVESFFRENSERFGENPIHFLEALCSACDTTVKKAANIDTSKSGR